MLRSIASLLPRAASRTAASAAARPMTSCAVSVNPFSGEQFASHDFMSNEAAGAAVEVAHETWRDTWRHTDMAERSARMHALAAVLRKNTADYSRMMALEMGKPLAEAAGEVEKCAFVCEYYAEHAEAFLAPEPVDTGLATDKGEKSFVELAPIGVVLILMPWNFPFWQVFRQAATALSAGNTMVLKHANNVFGCAMAIEEAFLEAGFPAGAFRNLAVDIPQVAPLIEHPRVRAVAFTGSTPVGKMIGAQAGALLKPCVLELGGSDPYIVLEDANLELAASACSAGRLLNAGQSCIGAKRFLVHEAVHDEFVAKLAAVMGERVMGDPLDAATTLGPMASHRQRDALHAQVSASVAAGAEVVIGGEVPDSPAAFYPPTVLTNVLHDTPAFCEETFGPVASVIKVRDEAHAIQVANEGSDFGLGGAVFTADLARGERVGAEIESGMVFVNDFVKSDPRLPFGGTKESGVGRECSHYGIKEFVNIKTVVVKQS